MADDADRPVDESDLGGRKPKSTGGSIVLRWIGGSPATGVLRKATVPTLFVSDGTRRAPVAHAAPETNTMMAIFGSADL